MDEQAVTGCNQVRVTFDQAEQALLRAVIDCADGGDTEQAREAAEAALILRQAQREGAAGDAATPSRISESGGRYCVTSDDRA